MVENGLCQEVEELHNIYQQSISDGRDVDVSSGIYQSIGWKEFLPYLTARDASQEKRNTSSFAEIVGNAETVKQSIATATQLLDLREDAIRKVKIATKRYAKTQIRWIRIKLLNKIAATTRTATTLYLMDGTDVANWDDMVKHPALKIAKCK
jgi:tRNA dimethylallyltransferase